MNEKKVSMYKGKGFVLTSANKEFVDGPKRMKKKHHKRKKKNIFSKFNPVTLPLLGHNRNIKDETEEKVKKSKKELNVLDEDEINSFLLRNKAFRLAWYCILEKIQDEINLEMSKNLKSVFEEIYLYSISNNEYLPLILITAGTNVADHEIIIDTMSYALKRWRYRKNKCHYDEDDSNFEFFKGFKNNKRNKNKNKNKNKGRNLNEENYNNSLLDKINYENENMNDGDDITETSDMYVCSLNSSTSNNINSAIFNIYEQIFKEYKKRYLEKRNNGTLNKRKRCNSTEEISARSRYKRNNIINTENIPDINMFEKELNAALEQGKEINGEDAGMHKKAISVDKLISLYKALSELDRKEDSSSEESENEDNDYDLNEAFLNESFGKLKLYNKTNNYFSDGRKKVRIIVLIHDCEYFNINALNGILNVLINLRIDNKICLSVILGVSTPSFFFNRITNPDTQSKLRIKTVDILNNKLICENICNGILFENVLPFMINFRTIVAIKMLLHKNNQSISHLINILYILTKEFYDNGLFSFLCLPLDYYLNFDEEGKGQGEGGEEIHTEYSPYTYVRSYQKSFRNYSKYNMRNIHEKIICLCYSANIYFRHMSFIKKRYSSVLIKGYFDLHKADSELHTPTNSDNETLNDFSLKKSKIDTSENGNLTKHKSKKGNCEKEKENDILSEEQMNLKKRKSRGSIKSEENKNEKEILQKTKKIKDEASENGDIKNDLSKDNETEFEESVYIDSSEIETTEFDSITNKNSKEKKKKRDLSVYAWQFKAKVINWWLDHPFRDLVYTYEIPKPEKAAKKELIKHLKKESVDVKENKEESPNLLYNVDNVKEINKMLCEVILPKSMLHLTERKYAFSIAINLISIILKIKPEYTNSTKRLDYFRKLFENYEKVKWTENKSIIYIEDIYKTVENDVRKCINYMIEIISPYYFKNQEVLLKMLKEFKKYYTNVYAIVYNLETYLYMLKQKEDEKNNDIFINDDFSRNFSNYSVTFSIYYSLLFKLDDLIEIIRKYINDLKSNTFATSNSKVYSPMKSKNISMPKPETIEENPIMSEKFTNTTNATNINNSYMDENNSLHNVGKKKMNKEKLFARYLTMENPSAKKKTKENKVLTTEDIADLLNMFLHDYLYLLLLPPVFYHPMAYELLIHKPDKEFTEYMTRDIKNEILTTLSYTTPYKAGNLMCSCCFYFEQPSNTDFNTNITCNNKIYLNPYYDNISTLEDLVNIYRIYERCCKTIDLYNFFIYFLNIKIDKFLGYSIEEKEIYEKVSESKEHLFSEMLQEYYLRFVIAIGAFCYFFKILKPPNVSALLNYDDKDFLPNSYDSKDGSSSGTSIAKFLSEIRKSLQGCTSKKMLFGKYYYNQTIISREFYLMKAVQELPTLDDAGDKVEDELDDNMRVKHKKNKRKNG